MIRILLLLWTLYSSITALEIIQKPIQFSTHRQTLTLDYIRTHYGISTGDITIEPRIIVVHFTAIPTFQGSFEAFDGEELPTSRSDISEAKATANVSVPYLIDKDGTIYQLMPDNWMGRHVIGLNYSSIGIENVGRLGTLTDKQLEANIALIRHLKSKYANIDYLIGHSDYRCFEGTPLWLERDPSYRTEKEDPGERFMQRLHWAIPDLNKAPCR